MSTVSPLFKFLARHPAIAAAGVGGTIAAQDLGERGEQLETEIMRNRLGSPGGKYVYSSFEKFAERKKFLGEKLTFYKRADADVPAQLVGSLAGGAGGETAKQVIQGLTGGVQRAARAIKDKAVLEPQRERILKEIVEEDPTVSAYESEAPGSAEKAFSSMRRVAPQLSTDPNVVAAYLREAAQTGGTTNYLTIKQLAETEAAINKAQGRIK